MPQTLLQALTHSWDIPLLPTFGIVLTAVIYLRGWRLARLSRPRQLPLWRALCFAAGLLVIWLALASPVDTLAELLLVAHMTQHLLLMSIAPPLLVLGCPTVPLLRGLPRRFVRDHLSRWMNSQPFESFQSLATNPVFAWLAMTVAAVTWHLPVAYDFALRSEFWHEVEHGCFFFTAVAFWWFIIRPWPSRIQYSRWMVVPYLVTAHLVLLGIATVLALSNSVAYATYASAPRLFGISAIDDQHVAAGEMLLVGMWVLVAALLPIIVQMLSPESVLPEHDPAAWPPEDIPYPAAREAGGTV